MFPKFLLPPSIFNIKKQNAGGSTPPSPRPGIADEAFKHEKYLRGHVSCIRCSTCSAHICLISQIISKGFTGRHGRAYLVSTESTIMSSSTDTLPNTLLQPPVPRHLVTGAHTVSDFKCASCGTVLGWKYVSAEEESQQYKVGKFILETKKVITTSAWDSDSDTTPAGGSPVFTDGPSKAAYDGIEFDSQDEDECEDLFSGIWSPGLAARRRYRKIPRRLDTLGIMSS